MKQAFIVGASGLIGGYVLDYLLANAAYSKVISFGRRELAINHPKLKQIVGDFEQLEVVEEGLQVDEIFCCLGTTIKKAGSKEAFKKVDFEYPLQAATWGQKHSAKHFLLISALGASSRSSFFYNQVKGKVEEELEQIRFKRLSILQPSLLIGEREETRIGEKFGEWFFKLFSFLFVGKWRKYRAIPALSVARTMFEVAQTDEEGVKKYESDLIAKIANRDR